MVCSCGASPGQSPAHMEAARSLAKAIHARGLRLVYGGGTIGLMGELARTLVSLAGPDAVHGIIPAPLVKHEQAVSSSGEKASADSLPDEAIYGRTTVVADMHTRKKLMAREVIDGGPGGGFVALSGGYGTLEELMEIVTWNQLGIHGRGIAIYNVEGYWDGLLKWVRDAVTAGFVGQGSANIVAEATTAEDVLGALVSYRNAEGRYQLEWGRQ